MDNLKILAPEDYLMHYGIEGQKWGIRRFQNADGTLTPAGRARYGYTGKKYGERVKTNMALGMTKEKAEQEAYKTTNRNSKIAQGFRTYIASGNAAATALYSTAAIAGGVAGVPAGWVAAVIGTPAVTAAAVGGYSIYRHFKNKKFQEGIRNNLTDSKKTEDKKFVDTIVGAGVNGRPSVMYKKSQQSKVSVKKKNSTTEKVPNNGHDMKAARSITNVSQIPKSSKPKMESNGEVSWLTSDGHIAYGEYDKKTGKIYGVSVNG